MKRFALLIPALLLLALTACAAEPQAVQSVDAGSGPAITVYRAPT